MLDVLRASSLWKSARLFRGRSITGLGSSARSGRLCRSSRGSWTDAGTWMGSEPFLKLLIVEERFDLGSGGFANLLHFGPACLGRYAPILHQRAHLGIFLIQNRLDLRFLVVGQLQEPGDAGSAVDLARRRSIRFGGGFLVGLILGLFLGHGQ